RNRLPYGFRPHLATAPRGGRRGSLNDEGVQVTKSAFDRSDTIDSIAAAQPIGGNTPDGSPPQGTAVAAQPTAKVSGGYIFWLMLANFGASIAMMVPLAYGRALRITELAPGHDEVLGYVTGTAQLIFLVLSPMIGIWSDRTRSRFGRRTPFLFLGAALGIVGAVI